MYSLVSGLSRTICRNYWGARARPEARWSRTRTASAQIFGGWRPRRLTPAPASLRVHGFVVAEKREFHLLLIGLDQAGKSSLLECIKYMYSSSQPSPHELDLVLRKVCVCPCRAPPASAWRLFAGTQTGGRARRACSRAPANIVQHATHPRAAHGTGTGTGTRGEFWTVCRANMQVQPTVGLNIGRLNIKKCSVLIWDLGGQVFIEHALVFM